MIVWIIYFLLFLMFYEGFTIAGLSVRKTCPDGPPLVNKLFYTEE